MRLTISDLALAESIADLKADQFAKIRGGIFGIRVQKDTYYITNNNQDAVVDNGGTAILAINSNVDFGIYP